MSGWGVWKMKIKYLFISEGSYDGYWVTGMIFGKEENIEKVKCDLKLIDDKLLVLKNDWKNSYKSIKRDEKHEMITYANWREMCDKVTKEIPLTAYKYDCTYVKMIDNFHFDGGDV